MANTKQALIFFLRTNRKLLLILPYLAHLDIFLGFTQSVLPETLEEVGTAETAKLFKIIFQQKNPNI